MGSTSITFPSTLTVGDMNVAGSISMTNQNSQPDDLSTNTVCNATGVPSPPCASAETGITLTPSCSEFAVNNLCTPAGASPGVFAIDTPATGRAGTACAGVDFDVAVIDVSTGAVNLTPTPGVSRSCFPSRGRRA